MHILMTLYTDAQSATQNDGLDDISEVYNACFTASLIRFLDESQGRFIQ